MCLSRKGCKDKKYLGLIVSAIGIGILLVFIIPIWGWIIACGVALIYCGWQIMGHHHHH